MRRFEITRKFLNAEIITQVLCLGDGIHVSVFGGTRPHIGAVSIVSPDGMVETTQFPGHKDGVVSARWAEALSEAGVYPCVVEVGIHYDDLIGQEIGQIIFLTAEMLSTMLADLSVTSSDVSVNR